MWLREIFSQKQKKDSPIIKGKTYHLNYEKRAATELTPVKSYKKGLIFLAVRYHKSFAKTRKFYIRRNNRKVDSIERGRIVIAHLLP